MGKALLRSKRRAFWCMVLRRADQDVQFTEHVRELARQNHTDAGMDQIPNELLLRSFRFLEQISQFRLRRACQQWNEILRSPEILATVKLDVTALDALRSVTDGSKHWLKGNVSTIILVAETLVTTTTIAPPSKRSEEGQAVDVDEAFLWRFGWLIHSQTRKIRTVILSGLSLSRDTFLGILYLQFPAGATLSMRDVRLVGLSGVYHLDASAKSRNLECIHIRKYGNTIPGIPQRRNRSGMPYFVLQCLLHHILCSHLADRSGWEKYKNDHKSCECQYYLYGKEDNRDAELAAKVEASKIRGTMEIKIVDMGSRAYVHRVNPFATVLGLQLLLEEQHKYPVEMQRLIFGGRQLEENRALSDYDITKDSTIRLVLRLRGGLSGIDGMPIFVRFGKNRIAAMTYPKYRGYQTAEDLKKVMQHREGVLRSKHRLVHKDLEVTDTGSLNLVVDDLWGFGKSGTLMELVPL